MKFSATRRALLAGVAFAAVLATGAFAADKPTMGIVVKIGGIPWRAGLANLDRTLSGFSA